MNSKNKPTLKLLHNNIWIHKVFKKASPSALLMLHVNQCNSLVYSLHVLCDIWHSNGFCLADFDTNNTSMSRTMKMTKHAEHETNWYTYTQLFIHSIKHWSLEYMDTHGYSSIPLITAPRVIAQVFLFILLQAVWLIWWAMDCMGELSIPWW